MTGMYADVDEVLGAVETAIGAVSFVDASSSATAYVLLDRLDQRPHLGVTATAPSTENVVELSDGVREAWVHDTIVVRLDVDVSRTPGQREQRAVAQQHEQRIRYALVSDYVLQPFEPTWLGSSRTLSDDRRWLQIEQRFRFRRIEQIRSVA